VGIQLRDSLRLIKLLGVKVIEMAAFFECRGLTDVEFGNNKLETIRPSAFAYCTSLRNITMPSVRTIDAWAFQSCNKLTELDLPADLDMVGEFAFDHCPSLRRITMPLKYDMIDANVFRNCPNLTTLNLVGGIHKTVALLHMESWRNGMRGGNQSHQSKSLKH